MTKSQEKLLVATLCGMVLTGAAAFVVQPAVAEGYFVDQPAQVTGVAEWDHLNVRRWPAAHSRQVGQFGLGSHVWVERCIAPASGSDWCLVDAAGTKGWVNARYLRAVHDRDL